MKAVKTGYPAAGSEPDELIGVLDDSIYLGGAEPLLRTVLFKIIVLSG